MQVRALLDGTKNFLLFLLRALVFPLTWMWALAIAKKHTDTDVNARNKVLAGIIGGIVLAGGGFYLLNDFSNGATESMYEQMDSRMSQATGASEYMAAVDSQTAADGQITTLSEKLFEAETTGDQANATIFEEFLAVAQEERHIAVTQQGLLMRNLQFYQSLVPLMQAQDDVRVKQMIQDQAAAWNNDDYIHSDLKGADKVAFTNEAMLKDSGKAFAIKDKAQADMAGWMNWIFLPGLIGAFYAPLVFALSSVLRNAWEPSESVGFKPYPGRSMAFFLAMGAFGVPALFFSAWTFWDMNVRSVEGQISL